jgi:RNA polymerase sigma-32 factor
MERARYTDLDLSRQARKAELLDHPTEAALARAWRDSRDPAALNRLITAHLRLAIAAAARFRRYGAPMNDLVQEASVGLMKAAEKFDPDQGVRFSTYANFWIKASLQDFVMRNWSMVRTGSTAGQKTLFFNLRRTQAKLEREARDRGEVLDAATLRVLVAQDLGVTLAEVAMMEARLQGSDASLNAPQASDAEGREWIELIPDDAPQPEAIVAAAHDGRRIRDGLGRALADLSPRERRIVAARQLVDRPLTLERLGSELGVSKERVRQIECGAYAKLRAALSADAPELLALIA